MESIVSTDAPEALNPARPSEVRAWITAHDFQPSKVLGQNFLIDGNILRIAVEAADPQPDDCILEVGPGLGILTAPLLEKAAKVVAIEKDLRLAGFLRERIGEHPKLDLRIGDALDAPLASLIAEQGLNKLAANLPYAIASRLLVNCFMTGRGFDRIAVTVQWEVAERLAAKPGPGNYGLLAIWAGLDYDVQIVKKIPPGCFYPRPLISSAIILLTRTRSRRRQLPDPAFFDFLIKRCFSQRRKQLGGLVSGITWPGGIVRGLEALAVVGIQPTQRPETLSVDHWVALASVGSAPSPA